MPEGNTREQDPSFGYLVSILGFGLCRAWVVFCLSIPLASPRFTNSWVFLLAGALAALVVFAIPLLAPRLRRSMRYLRLTLFRVTAVFLLIASVLTPCALWVDSWPLLLLSWVVGGIGAGLLQVLWGERFAAHPPRFSLTVTPAAAILTALVVALSLSEATLIVLFILPLVSFALLVLEVDGTCLGQRLLRRRPSLSREGRGREEGRKGGGDPSPSLPRPSSRPPFRLPFRPAVWKLMFSILVFSFICRSFDALPLQDTGPFAAFGGSALFALIIVGVTFLILAALLKERFNIALTYRLSLPLMVVGFAVLALFINSYAAMSLFLINMGYEFFDLLSWILFADVARRERDRWFGVFGLGVAFTFIGMALGYSFGEALTRFLMDDMTRVTGLVVLCMVALVLVAFLVIPEGTVLHLTGALFTEHATERGHMAEKDEGGADIRCGAGGGGTGAGGGGGAGDATQDQGETGRLSLEQSCAQVADRHRLTAREGEVLTLLARGRTLAIIARELSIAKGTVRTHIERVYAKLGVHKQQELIDLVEGFGRENGNHGRNTL